MSSSEGAEKQDALWILETVETELVEDLRAAVENDGPTAARVETTVSTEGIGYVQRDD